MIAKKKILFLTGVPINRTPILNYTIDSLSLNQYDSNIIEMKTSRFLFLINACRAIFFRKNDVVFFIGIQTLPLLWVSQFKKIIFFNWFLESYKGHENKSLVLKLLKIEPYIDWSKVNAIFPINERSLIYDHYEFKQKVIFPNVAKKGNRYFRRSIKYKLKIKLAMYGDLNNDKVYTLEFINFVKSYPEEFQLDFYGYGFDFEDEIKSCSNIYFHGELNHSELLNVLSEAHYSIIGYRPINFNSQYCAPNKLYEAMSLSLPVILNKNNPTLKSFESKESIGCFFDFSNLGYEEYSRLINESQYENSNDNIYKIYQNKYNLENFLNNLQEIIIK